MAPTSTLRSSMGASRCYECGKCTTSCPLAIEPGFAARRLVAAPPHGREAAAGTETALCLTCGSCETRCPQNVQISGLVRGLRARLPAGEHPPRPHGEVFQTAARLPDEGEPARRPLDWLDPDLRVADSGEVALFVGCLPLFEKYFRPSLGIEPTAIARAAIRVLNQAGIDPVLVQEEQCCGHDLLWGGDQEGFEALARANTAAFQERGVKHVLSTCAECVRTWRLDYAEVTPGYQPRVEHLAEFLASESGSEELVFKRNGRAKLTFHDPCRLGRHLGVFDAPRSALQRLPGVDLVEMEHCGPDANCCGTSGFIHCNTASRRLQVERLEEAQATGADALVTACPKCLIHLSCAQADARRRGAPVADVEVVDLTVLAAELLDAGAPAEPRQPAALVGDEGVTR